MGKPTQAIYGLPRTSSCPNVHTKQLKLRCVNSCAPATLLASILCAICLTTGCSDITIRTGVPPDITALGAQLRSHESNQQEVLSVLGRPYGEGRALMPFDTRAKTVWTYYYEEGTLEDFRRTFLFVFFEDNRFDGYLWFSSFPGSSSRIE